MLFSSLIFILCFLPLCLGCYYVLPSVNKENKRTEARNLVLLFFSVLFYALGGVKYLLLMLCVILVNYFGGFLVNRKRHKEWVCRLSLVLVIIINLSLLFFFKYFNFAGTVIENLFFSDAKLKSSIFSIALLEGNGALNLPTIVLPIGISFYTFQALSYVVDVFRGAVDTQCNFLRFSLYISFFPQLVAGPIVQYKDVETQLSARRETVERFATGITRFCYGVAKKVLIANTMAEVVDAIWKLEISQLGAVITWFGAICYSFQIYYDFSGYSDMAIGLGKMFGFEFKENFNFPYIAESIQDFWRRWHISLSSWFREYVYIPLGGNRGSNLKTYRNLLIVFLLTGIWHGANWTFFGWGIIYGILLVIEKAFLGKLLKKTRFKFLNRLLTFTVVTLLWVLFRADNIIVALRYLRSMFRRGDGTYTVLSYLNAKTLIALVFAVLLCGIISPSKEKKPRALTKLLRGVTALVLLVVSIVMLINGTYNPFIYFQF